MPGGVADEKTWRFHLLASVDGLLLLAKSEVELDSKRNDLRAACDSFGVGFRAGKLDMWSDQQW